MYRKVCATLDKGNKQMSKLTQALTASTTNDLLECLRSGKANPEWVQEQLEKMRRDAHTELLAHKVAEKRESTIFWIYCVAAGMSLVGLIILLLVIY